MSLLPVYRVWSARRIVFSPLYKETGLQRRDVVKLAALGAAGLVLPKTVRAAAKQIPVQFPIIDTHIHLFDTTRTWGVPWPAKDDLAL